MDTTTREHRFLHIDDKGQLTAWWLITICFALWGVASNVTTPMVGNFSKVFRITAGEASLVSFVYHLGYFCVAIPAALLIQKYSYKCAGQGRNADRGAIGNCDKQRLFPRPSQIQREQNT